MSNVAERFWSKVEKSGDCWLWKGCLDPHGYGRFHFEGNGRKAQRVAWVLTYGEIPAGQVVMHMCDNPPCVRPTHLRLGTQSENCFDMYAKRRNAQPRGERAGRSKLTEPQVAMIRARYAVGGVSTRKLGAEYGVSGNSIRLVVSRKSWRHVA